MNTKVILEFGCNHQGEIERAKRMINDACALGIWAVKFQKRDIEAIPDDIKIKPRSFENSFGTNYYEHRKALEFNKNQLLELKRYANSKDIVFICSAFDEKSIYDLIDIGCEYIKLPSQLYSDFQLKTILSKNKKKYKYKIILSTGMHSWEEIVNNDWKECVDILMHCISVYPHQLKEMNLIIMQKLMNIAKGRKFEPGYSSHDFKGIGIPYAIYSGAKYIERHYTTDKNLKGSDHKTVSSDYAEMKNIIEEINLAESILGDEKRECSQKEKETRKIYRGF
jgi:sialic acid synthase SpsE